MKKLFTLITLIFTVCAVFMLPAFAANLEGDAQHSAEALRELELFFGTDKGFELDRSMTRAEAAAMLVRFFGAEDKALAGSWKHPFTDVPTWADKYVGWLYASGLTNGVAPTRYGSQLPVTAWQYGTFITRALKEGEDIPQALITDEEISRIDAGKKFVRGDAAIISVRALGCQYTKNGNYRPLADVCIERGLFTPAKFASACGEFYGSDFTFDDEGFITRRILGIPVGKTADGGYCVFRSIDPIASDGTRYDPFVYKQEGDTVTVCTLNIESMEIAPLAQRSGITGRYNFQNLFKLGDTHYIFETRAYEDKNTLLAVREDSLEEILNFVNGGDTPWYPDPDRNIFIDGESALIMTDSGYYRVTESGYKTVGGENLKPLAYFDGCIFARRINKDSVDVLLIGADGEEKVSYNVPDDRVRGTYGEGYRDLDRQQEAYYYGEAGLYLIESGTLLQITPRPANGFIKMDDGSYVILTHEPGKRFTGITNFGGDRVMRVYPDGEERLLTRDNMDIAAIDSIFLKDGRVHFRTAVGVGMGNYDCYTYRIEESGKLTVTDFNAGRPEMMNGYTEKAPEEYKAGYIKKEQQRIDALGY